MSPTTANRFSMTIDGRIVQTLRTAYWTEIETGMSYIANSINPDALATIR